MQRAYSYIRFSSDKQAKGDSVRRQTSLRDAWIKKNKNKVYLDENTIEDFGLSAAKGDNLDPRKGNLGKFLKCCREGKIEPNSYLIMERIDRFSRQSTFKVGDILTEFVEDHQLKLVFLQPSELILDETNIHDTMNVVTIVLQLQLAYDESEKKSDRLHEIWTEKKKNTKSGQLLTKQIPAWINYDPVKNTLKVDNNKKKIINAIFDMSISGMGCQKIIKQLEADNVPPITEPTKRNPVPAWNMSYVSQLLSDRRLIGEMQPHTKRGKERRKLDGGSIQNYFPAVMTEDKFNKNTTQKSYRKKYKVVKNRKFVNILVGLVHCMSDGRKMTAQQRYKFSKKENKNKITPFLISTGRRNGTKYCPTSLDYRKFRDLMEMMISEISIGDLVSQKRKTVGVKQLRTNIEATKERIKILDDKIKDDKYTYEIDSLLELKIAARTKLVELTDKLDSTSTKNDNPDTARDAWKEYQKLTKSKEGWTQIRERQRALIPSIVERIEVIPAKYKRQNIAYGKMILTSGAVRNFVFCDLFEDLTEDNFTQYRYFYKDKKATMNNKREAVLVVAQNGIYTQAGTKPTDTIDSDTKRILNKVDDIFRTAEYHGNSSWENINKHLFDSKK